MENNNLQQLTKKQRKLLKRQEKEKERLGQVRNKRLKRAIMISAPLILIGGGIIFGLLNRTPQESHPGTPKIEMSSQEYDLGTISMANGPIKHTYEIKNTGDGDLKIDSIWTSCHCTTARLRVGDKTSKEFGMDKRSTSQKIAPRETGFLEVTFDPAFHGPQGIGSAVRAIYLSTNDPQNKKAEVRLVVNVTR